MLDRFSKDDKLAYIAVLVKITKADDIVAAEELEHLYQTAEKLGVEDFGQLFQVYSDQIGSQDEYLAALRRVEDPEVQRYIVDDALTLSASDHDVHQLELEAIREICEVWGIDFEEAKRRRLS